MLLPKPVVLIALVFAFILGHFLVWLEQRQQRSGLVEQRAQENLVNERMA